MTDNVIFSPDTHQLRCGKPWRLLEMKTDPPSTVIIAECVNSSNLEIIVTIQKDGTAVIYRSGMVSRAYDLLEIPIEPVKLPLGLNIDLRYARWSVKSKRWELAYSDNFQFSVFLNPRLWCMDDSDVEKKYVHRRINIGLSSEFWERVNG